MSLDISFAFSFYVTTDLIGPGMQAVSNIRNDSLSQVSCWQRWNSKETFSSYLKSTLEGMVITWDICHDSPFIRFGSVYHVYGIVAKRNKYKLCQNAVQPETKPSTFTAFLTLSQTVFLSMEESGNCDSHDGMTLCNHASLTLGIQHPRDVEVFLCDVECEVQVIQRMILQRSKQKENE